MLLSRTLLRRHNVLPGFDLALGFALLYLSCIVLIPLSAAFLRSFALTWPQFWETVTSPRVLASHRLTFGASFAAALVNAGFGLVVAWVLVRYRFPGKRVVDALVDLPFALPTAVAGIALTAIYAGNGLIGRLLPFKVSFTPLGVFVALVFIGLPFVVRTLQPVLEDVNRELEEVAATLGATRWQTFRRVIFPIVTPALLTGFTLAFARARRIRLGDLHRGQPADGERDHAASHHHAAGAVRLRRRHRHRGGDAGDRLPAAAGDQPAAGVVAPARRRPLKVVRR